MTCAVRTHAKGSRRLLPNSIYGTAPFKLYALIVALMLVLGGCATADRAPEVTPPVHIPETTRWQLDSDIGTASLAARGRARDYARGAVDNWRGRLDQRAEADFIPWFTGYWTQQWLAVKMSWYKLSAGEDTDVAVKRMSAYLQGQYNDRVLKPVTAEIDPDEIRRQATQRYVQFLSAQLKGIPQRYGVTAAQFDRRLKDIPAISLAPPPAHSVSLYQIVHADPLDTLPAYVALIAQIRKDASSVGGGPTDSRISPLARRTNDKLAAKLAASGGASVAAAAFGGVAGVMISLVSAGWGAMAHEEERPEMEARLRESLSTALDEMCFSLLEDPATGVMAGVFHLSGQIEASLARTIVQPVRLEPLPREIPLSAE